MYNYIPIHKTLTLQGFFFTHILAARPAPYLFWPFTLPFRAAFFAAFSFMSFTFVDTVFFTRSAVNTSTGFSTLVVRKPGPLLGESLGP